MILNPVTNRWLEAYISRPVSTLFIETRGDNASGIEISCKIHKELVHSKNNPLNILSFEDQKSIGIDDVRDIQRSFSLKADSTEGINRIVVIESAERLTPEAQNALLKLIEELPERSIIILLASEKESLLQTVLSRCFVIPVFSITEKQSLEYGLQNGQSEEEIKKAYIMSEGMFSDFEQLLNNPENEFSEYISLAKKFLQSSVVERQKTVADIVKRDSVDGFLRALVLTAKSGMRLSKTLEAKIRWKKILSIGLKSQDQLKGNVNTKLVLLNLSVSLP